MNCPILTAVLLGAVLAASAAAHGAASESSVEGVFHVRDFGALPGTDADCGPAIQAAIDAAIKHGWDTQVVLDEGVYRVHGKDGKAALSIADARRLTVRGAGEGTLLVITNPRTTAFWVGASERVCIEGLRIDHDPLPFTQGRITAVDAEAGWFELDIEEGFPTLDAPWFAAAPTPYGKWGMIFDAEKRQLKHGAPDFVFMKDWTHLEKRRWRMQPADTDTHKTESMAPGDRFVHMARGNGHALMFHSARRCTVRDVTVHASPGAAAVGVSCDRLRFERFAVRFPKNTPRLLTTDADGIHCQQNETGPTIEECYFEGMADDAINIYYPPNIVREVVAPNELVVTLGGQIDKGDAIQVFNPREGRLLGEVEAVEVESRPGRLLRVVFDQPVEGVVAGTDHRDADTLYNATRCGSGMVIRNNTFRNHRRYAMMVKGGDALVEGNDIEGIGGPAIVVGNDPHWPEGSIPRNIVIRNNTIRAIGHSMWYFDNPRAAAIEVSGRAFKGGVSVDRIIENVTIEGNTFADIPGAAIFLGATRGAVIKNNRVDYGPGARLRPAAAAVVVSNSEAVRIEKLRVRGDRDELTAALRIEPSVAPGEAGITWRGVDAKGTAALSDVDDQRE